MRTILNLAPAVADPDPELFRHCDILCANECETEMVTRLPIRSVIDAERATSQLLDLGCATVIITLGPLGAVYASSDDRIAVHIPVNNVNAVDTVVSSMTILLQRTNEEFVIRCAYQTASCISEYGY